MTEYTAKKVYIKDAAGDYAIPYVNPADNTNLGVVRPDGSTITVNNGVLSTNNKNLRAISAYANEGELLTDPDGLAFVEKYAHSTFDRSKFTVVGSPNITDDGIASFSSGNYISTGNNKFDFSKPWKIELVCNIITTGAEQGIWQIAGNDSNNFVYISEVNKIGFALKTSSSGARLIAGYAISNGVHKIVAGWDGAKYYLIIDDDTPITRDDTNSLSVATENRSISQIGRFIVNNSKMFSGSIDLKQFSITVDGVEVFSGNKTGIDTIKADDWTIPSGVSAPTITADGILTSTDSTHYLTKTFTNFDWGNWEIRFKNIKSSASTTNQTFIDIYGSGNNNIALRRRSTTTSNPNTFQIVIVVNTTVLVNQTFTATDTLNGYLGYDGTNYYWNINGATDTTASSTKLVVQDYTAYFGKDYGSQDSGYLVNAGEDLNCIEFYKNGNLVYQPCLKIPYTESKTGSKIVDSIYRNRVNDMADQFGYANYYTLSDTDFTLPQVELYGLIGQRTLRDSYRNGATYWELWSDRTLEIGGSCTSGVEYNLPRNFTSATDYVLSVPYSAKTASSFTPTASGDFIAKGLGVL